MQQTEIKLDTGTPTYDNRDKQCRHCKHCERHEINYTGTNIGHYCRLRRSGRTANGLLKIKATQPACYYYEPRKEN